MGEIEKTLAFSETKGIQFTLGFLLQVLGTVIMAVWGYSQLDARIGTISNATATHAEKIRAIEGDIKENQDKPIPSDHVQNTTLFAHDRELAEIRSKLQIIETRLYDSKLVPTE
jgi:hypothetical protein